MSPLGAKLRSEARHIVAVLVVAAGFSLGSCGSKRTGPVALPAVTKYRAGTVGSGDRTMDPGFRNQAGEAIAPVVIADDPVPAGAVPGASGQQGSGRATLNGDPNGLSRETLNGAIQSAMGSLAACFTNITQDPMVSVSFEADPSGRPSLIRVRGAPADAEHCIRSVVQGIRFPSFEGKGVQVDLPLSFHRATVAAPTASPQQPGENAPPLFMEP